MRFWKIKRSDGKFSTGGTRPRFNKTGKTWTEPHHVLSHLRAISDDFNQRGNTSTDRTNLKSPSDTYQDCEIVEYEIHKVGTRPVQNWIDEFEAGRERKYGK